MLLSLSIFPNPTSSFVYINYDESFRVDMYSLSGQQLLSTDFNTSHRIDVSGISKGIYILKITAANSSQIEKLIIQ